MPSKQNIDSVEAIKQDLNELAAMWVIDYRGLSVKDVQDLRRQIKQSDAYMKVYKNNLMKIAIRDNQMPDSVNDVLSGPSAFIFSHNDPVSSAKVLKDFAKSNDNLEIKGGIMDGQFVDRKAVEKIASLPSREQIYTMFAGALSGIARGIATSIQGVPRGVAQTISQVAKEKPSDAA